MNRILPLALALSAVLAGLPASSAQEAAPPDDLIAGKPWEFVSGAEFPPGGTGRFRHEKEDDREIGVLAYDFSGGGRYVAIKAPVEVAGDYSEFRFRAKAAQPLRLGVRLVDDTGQVFQSLLAYSDAGQWQPLRVDLQAKAPLHFGGAKDGVVHYPLRGVWIMVEGADAPGELRLGGAAFLR